TLRRPSTVSLPVRPVLRSSQKADDGYPDEEEALPLPNTQRDVPLMTCDRAFAADPERLERARYRLALDSLPPRNPTCQGHYVSKNVKHTLLDAASGILAGGLAALSAGAAAIHFAVAFEHFNEYLLYGVFFLVIASAQMIWAAIAVRRLPRWW